MSDLACRRVGQRAPADHDYTTLGNRIECSLGKCRRCNVGLVYVCKDGRVFSAAELATLAQEC